MDPLTRLVADRYARRTIQFDHRAMESKGMDLAEEAIQKINKALWPNKSLREQVSPREVFASTDVDLKDVRGKDKSLRVVVRGKSGSDRSPTAGADFLGISPRSGIIAMYLNSKWTPEALESEKYKVMTNFSGFLVHEVTHALDVLNEVAHYTNPETDLAAYYNQPSEFRAHSKQIVVEAMRALPRLKRKYPKGFPSLTQVVEELLTYSNTFLEVEKYFNRSNQNRLRQMLVREIQDSGIQG